MSDKDKSTARPPRGRGAVLAASLAALLVAVFLRRAFGAEFDGALDPPALADAASLLGRGAFLAASLAVLVLSALLRRTFGPEFDGGPPPGGRPPPEAVPICLNSDLTLKNRLLEYVFPFLCPVGSMTGSPVLVPDEERMEKGRRAMREANAAGYPPILETHDEEVVSVARKGESQPPLEIVLLKPKHRTPGPSPSAAAAPPPPLILWIHGGGFVVGEARDAYMVGLMRKLSTRGEGDSWGGRARDAVWASVEYRLAPEHPYPAAADDCLLALEHMLKERRWSGVHVAGASAGGHLAAVAALWALKSGLRVDSIYADVPAFPTNPGRAGRSVFDSESYRRNWYTRIPGVGWSEWWWGAYTGHPRALTVKGSFPVEEEGGPGGERPEACRSRDADDFCGGALSKEEWGKAAEFAARGLPPLLVLTSKGDKYRDSALPLMEVYKEVDSAAIVHHFDLASSHATGYDFDPKTAALAFAAWGEIIQSAATRRH